MHVLIIEWGRQMYAQTEPKIFIKKKYFYFKKQKLSRRVNSLINLLVNPGIIDHDLNNNYCSKKFISKCRI